MKCSQNVNEERAAKKEMQLNLKMQKKQKKQKTEEAVEEFKEVRVRNRRIIHSF